MAKEVAPIIIKRKKAGHGGGHGGAWKVAYADFVTAMMCFFLVMWLMGSDEESKSSVSHYFNNPTSAWRKDLSTKDTTPLGDRTGAGESVVNGAEGGVPDDLVQRAVRPINQPDVEAEKVGEVLAQFLSDENLMTLDQIRFSVPEELLFKSGTTDQWSPQAEAFMKKLGTLAKKYQGTLEIVGNYEPGNDAQSGKDNAVGSYEFQMSRIVNIAKHATSNAWVSEEGIKTKIQTTRTPAAEDARVGKTPARRVEFTLTRKQ